MTVAALEIVFCPTCRCDVLTDERGFCQWCSINPLTGRLDMAARRREQTRLASQRLRQRRRTHQTTAAGGSDLAGTSASGGRRR